MPKSCKRRPKRSGTTSDELLANPFIHAMVAVDGAEARADAATALSIIAEAGDEYEGKPFWRPWRVDRLRQLHLFGPRLPRWAISRWVLGQASQWLDPSGHRRVLRALETAMEIRGGPRPDLDPTEDRAQMIDRDWAFRQLALYELGGLPSFLRRRATAGLVARADRVHDWARAPMRGLELVDCAPLTLTWADVRTGEEIETINIGSAALVDDGECVIGRVVPIEEGAMFESAPLVVPYPVAFDVAGDAAGWVDILKEACRDYPATAENGIHTSGLHDFALLTDVPRLAWEPILHACKTLGEAVPGLGVDLFPCLAAWLVQPDTVHQLMGTPLSAEVRSAYEALANLVREPAAGVLRELAEREAA